MMMRKSRKRTSKNGSQRLDCSLPVHGGIGWTNLCCGPRGFDPSISHQSDYGSPVARRPDDNQAARSDENFSLTFISYSAKSSWAKTSRHLPFVPLLKK